MKYKGFVNAVAGLAAAATNNTSWSKTENQSPGVQTVAGVSRGVERDSPTR